MRLLSSQRPSKTIAHQRRLSWHFNIMTKCSRRVRDVFMMNIAAWVAIASSTFRTRATDTGARLQTFSIGIERSQHPLK
jgi:hypothetical protein